jgi:hypothetical protein
MDVILQHDLLCRMGKAHRRQPTTVGERPGAGAAVNPLVPQQKALQVPTRLRQHLSCRRSGPHQIAHRLVCGIGDPDRRQLAGAVQLGQHQRVATVGLDPISRLDRDQRRRHHDTVMPAPAQQTVNP